MWLNYAGFDFDSRFGATHNVIFATNVGWFNKILIMLGDERNEQLKDSQMLADVVYKFHDQFCWFAFLATRLTTAWCIFFLLLNGNNNFSDWKKCFRGCSKSNKNRKEKRGTMKRILFGLFIIKLHPALRLRICPTWLRASHHRCIQFLVQNRRRPPMSLTSLRNTQLRLKNVQKKSNIR